MIKLLIKINLMRMLSPRKRVKGAPRTGGGGKGLVVAYALVAVLMLLAFGAMASGIAIGARTAGAWFLCEVAAVIGFMMMFIGSVFYAVTSLFDAKDNDLLLSMPVKPGDIIISRLVALVILTAVFGGSTMIPFAVVGAIMGVLSVWQALLLTLGCAVLLIASVALICFIAWAISHVTSRVKHKQAALMVLMLLAFAAYVVIYPNIGRFVSASIEKPLAAADFMSKLYPFYVFGKGFSGDSPLMLAAFVAVTALMAALAFLLLKRSFIDVITRKTAPAKKKTGRVSFGAKSALRSLAVKEIRRFTGSAVYMFNAGLGLLMMIALAVALIFAGDGFMNGFTDGAAFDGKTLSALIAAGMTFITAMTVISAPSVSLEGKMLWVARSAPVSGSQVLRAKVNAHVIISVPFIIVSSLLCVIRTHDFVGALLIMLVTLTATAVMAHVGVIINTLMPRFDNESDTRTIKQSGAVMFSMLVGVIYALIVTAVGVFAHMANGAYFAMAVAAIINAAVTAALYFTVAGPMARRFESFPA